ncbi:OB-fold domain-containing protein [Natronolimnohabitans sp. A-GB9]|uniref:Zn-ribbon domain-containing OB-fold protein n=1 Tax=Natronolimnohabitans sp. A-GB9 TaxID=3069757 RepID=UPI0027B7E257|nr:OB-fold domain-containing protein [Natronolimnohabitans sp. A-GB9]MDQ2049837.1 OB-fold domain-containing protein [Natronolimnohabitans sp. A-GB9]
MSVEATTELRDVGHGDWLDALEADDGFYLLADGEPTVPPAAVGPSSTLEREPLPETGTVTATTTIHVPHPDFADDAPYAVALVDFGPVTLTGQVTGVDPEAVERGLEVEPTVRRSATDDERLVGFVPAAEEVSDR